MAKNKYYQAIISENMYSTKKNLEYYLDFLFQNINFKNKIVLDIGAGNGIFSFYAAIMNAKKVICLEPLIEGSKNNMENKFKKVRSHLKLINKVLLYKITLQDYIPNKLKFDIIILHHSINHLNEKACIKLKKDKDAQLKYQKIFNKLYELCSDNAQLIICDCSSDNIFPLLRIKNPFARNIEWHKHQSPHTWISLLHQSGFNNPKINWSSFNQLGLIGKILLRNRIASFLLNSHFRITMQKIRQEHY